MTRSHLRFQVDSRLATLLSQEYSSSERALKELVDNAWDADAEVVSVTLPKPMSGEPIVIQDDGTGMTEEELRRHYLSIAADRRSRRGERTSGKNRLVKGRKGIGKFAGLMAAAAMTLETRARGRLCRFTLRLDDLSQVEDIEQLDIGLHSEPCAPELHGTSITLSDLHQGLAYPDANKLRQILLQDYGRQDDFSITVDGKRLDVDDVSGSYSELEQDLPNAGKVKLSDIHIQKTGEPDILQTSDGRLTLSVPIRTKRRSGRKLVTLPNGETVPVRPWDMTPTPLQLALARGHRWLAMLESGEAKSLKEIAAREGIDNSYVSRMVNLTTLAPDIVAAILDDALPNHITLFDLAVDPPALWDEQRERVGL